MANPEILNRKDPLTGFHTKEGLGEYLSSKIASLFEKTERLSVIILDLDNFKGINDRYGHLVGDDALRYFSMVINKALRGQHFVARYGGDEFVIVMPDSATGKDSFDVAGRIRVLFRKERFHTPRSTINIRSSIGIATYPADAKTARELLGMADQALYYAKKHGRNKIVRCSYIKAHSFLDKLTLFIKLAAAIVLIAAVLVSYFGTGSLKGVVVYYQNIHAYIDYQLHFKRDKHNYCYLEFKNGRKVEGWIVKENSDMLFISISKPILILNPLRSTFAIAPVKIPKAVIYSSIKTFKK